jgi:tRNA(Arg) A34 adenosine deaminase TadA
MGFFQWRSDVTAIISRRKLLMAAGGIGIFSLFGKAAAQYPSRREEIDLNVDRDNDNFFIRRAFELRDRARELGDQAYGAVVVLNGQIVGESISRVILDEDPTGHAEMSALRDAAKKHGSGALIGATLYSSGRPCSMCQAAADWVGILKMIYGRNAIDGGAPCSCG